MRQFCIPRLKSHWWWHQIGAHLWILISLVLTPQKDGIVQQDTLLQYKIDVYLTRAGEILTFWHHIKLTIPAELWGHITHISVYLWGILLDGGMTEKKIKSLCCLSTFAWTFPATSAEHFLAFAFLATTFWPQLSKECVMTGVEGLMSSGSVTDVPGTLFRMRNTFCWTVRMNI